MNKYIVIILLLKTGLIYAQSKKEQIRNLKLKTDSLTNLVIRERGIHFSNSEHLINLQQLAQKKSDSLMIELARLNHYCNKIQQENSKLKLDLNFNQAEITQLKGTITTKTDSLIILNNEIKNIKSKILNNNSQIPENNFDALSNQFIHTEIKLNEFYNWINEMFNNTDDGNTSYFTKECLSYITDVIDYYWGYPGSIDAKTLNKRWKKHYDLKYTHYGRLFINGNGSWQTKELSKIEFLGELNNGYWFKLTIKGGGGINDYSCTLIRVIKVIRLGNKFYIDNFLSLFEKCLAED